MAESLIWELVGRLRVLAKGEDDEQRGLRQAGAREEKSDNETLL